MAKRKPLSEKTRELAPILSRMRDMEEALDEISLDVPTDTPDEDPKERSRRHAREDAEARFLRAKEWAKRQNLLRVEVETPSGRLVTYGDPAAYLEAFATDEVIRARREWEREHGR